MSSAHLFQITQKKRSFVGFWSVSQAVHPCVLGDHGGGSAPLGKVHSSAGLGGHRLLAAVVVDLAVQRLRGDDPRRRTPSLERVRSFHSFLDLLSWAWFAILWGLTYWRKNNQTKEKNRTENSIMRKVRLDWSPGLLLRWNRTKEQNLLTQRQPCGRGMTGVSTTTAATKTKA